MCVTVAGGKRGGVGRGHKLFCHLAGGGAVKYIW